MSKNEPLIVAISRQFGAGGAYIGERVAARMKALYVDHQIVEEAARKLKLTESEIKAKNIFEIPSWVKRIQSIGKEVGVYVPPALETPFHDEFYDAQVEVIKDIAQKQTCVFTGHGGIYHILRDHPNLLSVLLYASFDFRKARLNEIYKLSEKDTVKLIHRQDDEREKYLQALTGKDWRDVTNYHLCLNSGVLGMKATEEIIVQTINLRFGITIM